MFQLLRKKSLQQVIEFLSALFSLWKLMLNSVSLKISGLNPLRCFTSTHIILLFLFSKSHTYQCNMQEWGWGTGEAMQDELSRSAGNKANRMTCLRIRSLWQHPVSKWLSCKIILHQCKLPFNADSYLIFLKRNIYDLC